MNIRVLSVCMKRTRTRWNTRNEMHTAHIKAEYQQWAATATAVTVANLTNKKGIEHIIYWCIPCMKRYYCHMPLLMMDESWFFLPTAAIVCDKNVHKMLWIHVFAQNIHGLWLWLKFHAPFQCQQCSNIHCFCVLSLQPLPQLLICFLLLKLCHCLLFLYTT